MRVWRTHTAACLAAAVTPLVLAVPTAQADTGLVAFDRAGARVGLGSVLARGVPSGDDACAFGDEIEIVVASPHAVVLATSESCEMVVAEVRAAGSGDDRAPGGPVRPGLDEDPVGSATAPPTVSEDTTGPRRGWVTHTAVDRDGRMHGTGTVEAAYQRDPRTGALSNARIMWAYCGAGETPLSVQHTEPVMTNEVLSCRHSLPRRGPDVVEARATGIYRHLFLMEEKVRYRLDHAFVALRGTTADFSKQCTLGIISGEWPRGWRTGCDAFESAWV